MAEEYQEPGEDDEVAIICKPCTDGPPASSTQSEKVFCSDCGVGVWLAASSRRLMATTPQAVVFCTPCGLAKINTEIAEKGRDEVKVQACPGAAEEFAEEIKRMLKAEFN